MEFKHISESSRSREQLSDSESAQRKSAGRGKNIEIKRIENTTNRQVTFCKKAQWVAQEGL
ncbi:unnamed protein product [Rhodiola kirilowii]